MRLERYFNKRTAPIVIFFLFVVTIASIGYFQYVGVEGTDAVDFTAVDQFNRSISLSQFSDNIVILHITQLENPICSECEQYLRRQIQELETLANPEAENNVTIITLNLRKNPYSEDGWQIAQDAYGINISWHWVEEYEPYNIANQYLRFWQIDGGFANPTLIFIGQKQKIVGSYHIYSINKGEIDGIQTAESISSDASKIISGEWDTSTNGSVAFAGTTFASLFLLGVVTSFSPCSIALLFVMISYIGAVKGDWRNKSESGTEIGIRIGIWFTIGMAIIFMLIGALISFVGLIIELSSVFYLITGIILIILGVNVIKPLSGILRELVASNRRSSGSSCDAGNGRMRKRLKDALSMISRKSPSLAAFLLGMLFSVGWAPCALSLIFPVIVIVLSQGLSLIVSASLMFMFGLGHGIVIIPFCAATGGIRKSVEKRYLSASRWIQPTFGAAIALIGMIFAVRYLGVYLW